MNGVGAIESLEKAVLGAGLPPECRILVAVSGGPDSVALLDTMIRLARRDRPGWELRAGHVNHQLRGAESDGDEHFVRTLCQKLDIGVDVASVDTLKHVEVSRLSLETSARQLRYAALYAFLDAWNGDVLVTAHTANDQAETMLMRLLRGAGLSGLGGIHAHNGRLVRPFLSVRRETIIVALQQQSLGYRVDSSNFDTRHFRNRMRSRVVPALQREAPLAVSALARTALLLQEDGAYLKEETQIGLRSLVRSYGTGAIQADARLWRALHLSIQRTTIRNLVGILIDQESTLDAATVDVAVAAILSAHDGRKTEVELAGEVFLSADSHTIFIRRGRPSQIGGFEPLLAPFRGSVQTPAGLLVISEQDIRSAEELQRLIAVTGPFHALCDATRLGDEISVRSRRPGDRFRPLGLGGSRKLQDIFVDHHVPAALRDSIAIVENERHPVWAPGLILDQRVALDTESERVIHLCFLPNAEVYHGIAPPKR